LFGPVMARVFEVRRSARKKSTLPPSSFGQRQGGELGPIRSDWRSRKHEFDTNTGPLPESVKPYASARNC
jgi:hypothetical protein